MVGTAARAAQWLDAAAAFVALLWYLLQLRRNRVRWEVIYVAFMSTVITLVKIIMFGRSPFYFEDAGGDTVVWIRYAGWLITCPVLLIHLSNLAGEDLYDGYRMLRLVLSNQIMLVCAATGAMSTGDERYAFFITGICCCSVVFASAAAIFWEAYTSFPPQARPFVQAMAGIFYPSWVAYALLWLFGDTGLDLWSQDACIIGHALADIASKTVWGFLGWWLRWHVLRKAGKLVGSVEVQLEDPSLGTLEISPAMAAMADAIPTEAADFGAAQHQKEEPSRGAAQQGVPGFKLRRGSMMLRRRPSILMGSLNDSTASIFGGGGGGGGGGGDAKLVDVTSEVNSLVQAALYNLEDTSTEATMIAALRLRAALQTKATSPQQTTQREETEGVRVPEHVHSASEYGRMHAATWAPAPTVHAAPWDPAPAVHASPWNSAPAVHAAPWAPAPAVHPASWAPEPAVHATPWNSAPPHTDIFGPTTTHSDEAARRRARRVSLARSFMSDGSQFSELALDEEGPHAQPHDTAADIDQIRLTPRTFSAPAHRMSAHEHSAPTASSFCAPTTALSAETVTDEQARKRNLRSEVERLESLLQKKLLEMQAAGPRPSMPAEPQPQPQPQRHQTHWWSWASPARTSHEASQAHHV